MNYQFHWILYHSTGKCCTCLILPNSAWWDTLLTLNYTCLILLTQIIFFPGFSQGPTHLTNSSVFPPILLSFPLATHIPNSWCSAFWPQEQTNALCEQLTVNHGYLFTDCKELRHQLHKNLLAMMAKKLQFNDGVKFTCTCNTM